MRQIYKTIFLVFLLFFFYKESLYSETDKEHIGTIEPGDVPVLSLGYTMKDILAGDVPEEDTLTAMEMWTKELASKIGLRGENKVYDDMNSLLKDFKDEKIDLAVGSALEYIKIRNEIESELAMGFLKSGRQSVKHLLLVPQNSGIERIEDLKGKTLATVKNSRNSMLFLNIVLLRNKKREADHYFSKIIKKSNSSEVVLSVFFKEFDAGIATDTALEVMSELNPQIIKRLKIIETSPLLIESISFFRRNYKYKDLVRTRSITIKDSPKGRQFLMLFKTEALGYLKESDLKPMEALYNEYKKLLSEKESGGTRQ